MGQVLHGSATTTEAVRRAIQNSQENLRALARHCRINHAVAGAARLPLEEVAQCPLSFRMTVSTAWIRSSEGNGLLRYATQPASKAAL